MLGDPRPPLRQGSHATVARLGQRGWLAERVPATALARFLPRSASTRLTLAGEARLRTRSPFSQLPALTSAATGAAQSSLEARGSLSGRKAVLLKEQLLLPDLCVSGYSRRAVHEPAVGNASAPRSGAERYLAIPELTCVRRIRFAQPRRPLPGAPEMSGEIGLP